MGRHFLGVEFRLGNLNYGFKKSMLKGPKLEIFGSRVFTQIRSV